MSSRKEKGRDGLFTWRFGQLADDGLEEDTNKSIGDEGKEGGDLKH